MEGGEPYTLIRGLRRCVRPLAPLPSSYARSAVGTLAREYTQLGWPPGRPGLAQGTQPHTYSVRVWAPPQRQHPPLGTKACACMGLASPPRGAPAAAAESKRPAPHRSHPVTREQGTRTCMPHDVNSARGSTQQIARWIIGPVRGSDTQRRSTGRAHLRVPASEWGRLRIPKP